MDMCALSPQTQFCDEYGYEIVLVRVIFVAHIRTKNSNNIKTPSVLCKDTSLEELASSKSKCSPFRIPLTLLTQQCLRMVDTLIDQDGNLNVLTWEMWNALSQPKLSHTKLGFIKFSQVETTCLGCIYLQMCNQGELIYTLFYVANKSEILESVILGRTWMRKINFQLD